MLTSYQKRKTLNMDEIWNIELFIKIAIIENIKDICEKIYASQMQKYRAENIIERLVELKTKENQVFNKKPYNTLLCYNPFCHKLLQDQVLIFLLLHLFFQKFLESLF